MRALLLAALAASLAAPAAAQSDLSLRDISQIYCDALIAADMAPLEAILTPDLATTIAGHADIVWQGAPGAVTACQQVGASGSYDHPEAVLFYTLADGKTASDRLVLSFIDDQLRLDDVTFANGGSLRASLKP